MHGFDTSFVYGFRQATAMPSDDICIVMPDLLSPAPVVYNGIKAFYAGGYGVSAEFGREAANIVLKTAA